MWFAKSANGFRGWFAVTNARGALETNLISTDFLVTIRNPQDTSESNPSVSESGKPGLYRFDVSNTFLQTHGPGSYAVLIEVTTAQVKDIVSHVLQVNNNDFDSLTTGSVSISQENIDNIAFGVWNVDLTGSYVTTSAAALLITSSLSSASIDVNTVATSIWSYSISGSSAADLLNSSSTAQQLQIDYGLVSKSVWDYSPSGTIAYNLLASASICSSSAIQIDYSQVANSVWEFNVSGSATADLVFSSSLASSASINYLDVSDAVWNSLEIDYSTPGTFGHSIQNSSTSINAISSSINTILNRVDEIRDIQYGRWKIENNQMIFYKDDNVTEVARFDLYDNVGIPTMDAVFERIKI
jgi:hypothetical protein